MKYTKRLFNDSTARDHWQGTAEGMAKAGSLTAKYRGPGRHGDVEAKL
jgi:hypothetical protein